jgi:hypothetical protein
MQYLDEEDYYITDFHSLVEPVQHKKFPFTHVLPKPVNSRS